MDLFTLSALKKIDLGYEFKFYKMVEVIPVCLIPVYLDLQVYTQYWLSKWCFVLSKIFWNEMKKKGNKS